MSAIPDSVKKFLSECQSISTDDETHECRLNHIGKMARDTYETISNFDKDSELIKDALMKGQYDRDANSLFCKDGGKILT